MFFIFITFPLSVLGLRISLQLMDESSKQGALNRFLNFFTSAPELVSQKAEADVRGFKVLSFLNEGVGLP